MAKTILRIHANGDFETMVPLLQDKNLYVIDNSEPGYIHRENGNVWPKIFGAMTSEFIQIKNNEKYTFQINWNPVSNIDYKWACGYFYNADKLPIGRAFEIDQYGGSFYETTIMANSNEEIRYIRLSSTFLDDSDNTKLQFEAGVVATEYQKSIKDIKGYYLDKNIFNGNEILTKPIIKYKNDDSMPSWVKVNESIVSFFEEGILIKGNLMQS